MRVLMLSEDENITIPGTEARSRMELYANTLGELHIVAPTRSLAINGGNKSPLFIYPMRQNIILRSLDAYKISKNLCREINFDLITVQAPDGLGLVGLLIAGKFKIPLQFQIHTDLFSNWY